MKISIIGANSFIARNLIYYIKQNFKDYVLNLYDYNPSQADNEPNYKQINILDINSVKNIDFDSDIIYVFAGKTGTLKGFSEYETYIDVNEKGLLNILTEYKNQNSKGKIVFPSSRLVYKGQDKPLKEDDENEFKTVYAINKFACEQYLKIYNRMYDIRYVIFRVCVPYGSMIPNVSSYGTAEFMMKKALSGENITLYGQGEVRRTLTNIQDLCAVLLKGALSEKCLNDVFNIGGEDYSLKEMAQEIAKKYNIQTEYTPWPDDALKIESGSTVFNSKKLDSAINCAYTHTFKDWISA